MKRNTEPIDVLVDERGYDDHSLRSLLEMAERATHHPPPVHATREA
ncbi:hypothetical protein [Halalkalicoccus salilacus]